MLNSVLWRMATSALAVVMLSAMGVAPVKAELRIERIRGQAELGTIELHGVSAGDFDPRMWEEGTLNFVPDIRLPLLEPRKGGVCRNIYAPSAVETEDGWRLFYGAWDGVDTMNDRIYSVSTRDFVDFGERRIEARVRIADQPLGVQRERAPTPRRRLAPDVHLLPHG